MSPSMLVSDCPECHGRHTVILGTCSVCFAEFLQDADDADGYFSLGRTVAIHSVG